MMFPHLFILCVVTGISQNAPLTVISNDTVCSNTLISVPVRVVNFTGISVISLRIEYDTTVLRAEFSNTTFNPVLVGAMISAMPVPGGGSINAILISWMQMSPVTLEDNSILISLGFYHKTGSCSVSFNNSSNDGQDCEYADANFNALNDQPTASFYLNGTIRDGENAGVLSGGTMITLGESTGLLTLSGQIGTVLKWQRQLNGSGYADIPGTAGITIYSEVPSSAGTWSYRVKVKYKTCMEATSVPTSVIVSNEKTLKLKVYLEGLFDLNSGFLNKTRDCTDGANTFDVFPFNHCDTLSVLLANDMAPWNVVFEAHAIYLDIDGSISDIQIPAYLNGNYYIVIRHRQSLETWSAAPVSFNGTGSIIPYDFTTSGSQAFGNNLKVLGETAKYALYTGDLAGPTGYQDGYVDIFDNNAVFNQTQNAGFGYMAEDLTGDGFVDIFDMALAFNNMQNSIGLNTPQFPL